MIAVVMLCALAFGAGCTSDGKGPAAGSASPVGVAVHTGTAAEASGGDARIVLPAASVVGEGRLRVEADQTVPTSAAGLLRYGEGVRVELSGTALSGRATVEFKIPAGWDANMVPVIAWQDGKGGWRWLPTSRWKPGQLTVTAQTDHFSSGFLGGFDVGAAAKDAVGRLGTWISGRAGVAQPRCLGESSLRTRVAVSSDGGDSVKWCAGLESGHTILRIANNRLAYTQVTYPKAWKVVAGDRLGLSTDGLIQLAATSGQQMLKPPGKSVVLVRSGQSITLQLPDVPDALVLAEISQAAYFLQILELAFTIEGAVSKAAGQAVGALPPVLGHGGGFMPLPRG
ncbi:hypothetical protein ABZX12_41450 [Kribbella sp. NPDC003505]|uniref:hypothetical protein n=1 Tax=Kribbella sp. NPDC003505 TaxID=3154448 RepID=UPI00339F295E